MPLDLRHGSGRDPVTIEELNVQLANANLAEWHLIGGEFVRIGRLTSEWYMVALVLPGDWEGSALAKVKEFDLDATIQAAYQDCHTKKEGVIRARKVRR
jgi:hypothetical protein